MKRKAREWKEFRWRNEGGQELVIAFVGYSFLSGSSIASFLIFQLYFYFIISKINVLDSIALQHKSDPSHRHNREVNELYLSSFLPISDQEWNCNLFIRSLKSETQRRKERVCLSFPFQTSSLALR